MANYYLWIKAFHLIAVISWMAGLLYLPRLYVYHSLVEKNSDMDKTFQIMEKKLLKIIMNPAMVLSYLFGIILVYIYGLRALGTWFHLKFLLVLILSGFHGFLAKYRKDFAMGVNSKSDKFFRTINEIPTIIMIAVVILVIVKP